MEEISSRFSKDAGSEEIIILERECEDPSVRGIREETTIDDRYDDMDLFTPSTQREKQTHPPTTLNEQSTTDKVKDKPVRCSATGE
jgi:hypothetical protein